MSAEPSRHIVYHSRLEAEIDQFWWEFVTDNPEIVLAAAGAMLAIAFGMIVWAKLGPWRNRR